MDLKIFEKMDAPELKNYIQFVTIQPVESCQ